MVHPFGELPLNPPVEPEHQSPYSQHAAHLFYKKRKRGRLVGKRELAEKYWSGNSSAGYFNYATAGWIVNEVIPLLPSRPYPNLPAYEWHYKRDWKGQRRWIQDETAYERDDLSNDCATSKTANYSVSKPPKYI